MRSIRRLRSGRSFRRSLLLSIPVALSLVVPAVASEVPGKEPPAPAYVPSAADQRARAIEDRAARLSELVEARSGLGVYYDNARSDLVVVVPASGPGADITARELPGRGVPARIETRAIRRDTVDAINKAIEVRKFHANAGKYSYASRLDLYRGVMVVQTDAPAEVAAGLINEFPGAIEVVHGTTERLSRRSDPTPHWGGASITSGGGTCSSGFTVQNGAGTRFMVTAGHCWGVGAVVSSPDWPNYAWGSVVSRASFPTWDLELIGNSSYGAYVYTGPVVASGQRKMLGAGDPVVGFTNYCHSGQTTGEGCSHTVTGLNGQFCDASGCTPGLITYTGGTALQPGDSGSPFYVYASDPSLGIFARGINIAHSGSTMFAEKWSTVASYFGVSIVT